jgi:hypothetical protein
MEKELSNEQSFFIPIVTRSNSTEEDLAYSAMKESLLDSPSTLKYNLTNGINESFNINNKSNEQMYIKSKLVNIYNKIDYLLDNSHVKLDKISLNDYYKLYECLLQLIDITNNPSGDKDDDLNALNLQKKIIDIMIQFLENNKNLINN